MPIQALNTVYTPSLATAQTREGTRTKAIIVSMIIAMMLFIVVLSVRVFSAESLRLDESQSLWQASHNIPDMVRIVAEDVHVPLYHLMLHFWQIFFGNSVVTARLLSLIFFLAVIPAMYALGKLIHSSYVGLVGAILLSISPFMNWYGNEIRMYSLFTLLTVLNQYFFVRIILCSREGSVCPNRVWVGYGLTCFFGIFTHYFFFFNLFTQLTFAIVFRDSFVKGTMKRFLWTWVGLAVIYSPWIYYVFNLGAASNTQPLLSTPTAIDVFNTFSQFIFGFQDDRINTMLVSLWPLLVLLVFMSLKRNQRVPAHIGYLFFSLFIPILLAFAISMTFKPVYSTRYLVLTLPALYLIVAWMLSVFPRRLSNIFSTVLVMVMLVTLTIEIVNTNTPVKEDYREVSQYLSTQATPSDVIAVSAPFTIYPIEYYYDGPAKIQTLPEWDRLKTGSIPAFSAADLPAQVDQIKDKHQVLWLVLSYDQGYAENIRLYFDTHFERVAMQTFSPGLKVYGYKLRYDVLPDPLKASVAVRN